MVRPWGFERCFLDKLCVDSIDLNGDVICITQKNRTNQIGQNKIVNSFRHIALGRQLTYHVISLSLLKVLLLHILISRIVWFMVFN